jgi:hypothetical protein
MLSFNFKAQFEIASQTQPQLNIRRRNIGPCHVSGIFLPLRVKSLPLATIYEVKIPLRKWKKSLLQRNPAQMTSAILYIFLVPRAWPVSLSLSINALLQNRAALSGRWVLDSNEA